MCDEVAAALPAGVGEPTVEDLAEMGAQLESTYDQADAEARAAMDEFAAAAVAFQDALAEDGLLGSLDENTDWINAISDLSEKCESAGSTALQ